MIDYQRVVEYLRDIRLQPNKQVTEDVRRYATEFAELCKQANDRLRQCSTFLGQGLRSEAIHMADEQPNLMDLVAALDLPDPDAWAEFCQQSELPVPPPLQMDRAAQLNEAYAQDQPMEHLLSRHRLLALSRAPIAQRLEVLRQIATQEAGSSLWEKSVRTFEKARLRELPAEFLAAVKNKDAAALTSLHREITQPWLEPVPADIQSGVADAYERLKRIGAEAKLRDMVKPLREAFAARSYGECAALVQKWRNVITEENVTTIAAELAQEIEPVVAWLKEEDELRATHKEFLTACRNFTNLLDAEAPSAELEGAYAKARQFDEPIPDAIEARYREVIQRRVAAAAHRHRMQMALLGGAIIVILGILAAIYVVVTQTNAAKGWTRRMNDALATHNPTAVKALLEEQEKQAPGLSSDPALAEARRQAKQLITDAETDTRDLHDYLGQLEAAQTKASTALKLEHPEDILRALADANNAMEHTSRDLHWVDPEGKLETAHKDLQRVQQQLSDKVAQSVQGSLAQLGTALDAVASQEDTAAATALQDIADKTRAIQKLTSLDKDSQTAVTALLARVDQQQKLLDDRLHESQALQSLRQQATSADELKKALQDFVAKFPNSPRNADFTRAQDRNPFDKSLEAWRPLQAGWDGQFAAANAAMVQKRADAVQAYLTTYPGSPLAAAANVYLDYLKRASDALAEKGTWQTAFSDMLSNPLMAQLAYVDLSDGRRYYVLGDLKRVDHRLNDMITTTFEAMDPQAPTKRLQVHIESPVTLKTPQPIPVPHTKFALEMAEKVKLIDENNWETFGIDMVDNLSKATDMDLVVRATLIEQAIKSTDAADGWALGGIYQRAIADFARLQLGNIVWYDPMHPVSKLTLGSLQRVIDGLPKSDEVKQRLAAKKAELFKQMGFSYVTTGVLLRDSQGNWTLQPSAITEGTIAWAVSPVPAGLTNAAATPAAPAPAATPAPTAPEAPASTATAPAPVAPGGDEAPPPPPTAPAPAPVTPPAPAAATPAAGGALTPAFNTTLVRVAEFKGNGFVVDRDAVKDLPQGTLVFIAKP